LTTKLCEVVAAGKPFEAACEAETVTVPAPVMVRVLPLMDPGPVTTAKVTGRPEVAVAERVSGEAP
jgi:hypothetical protein